MKKEQETETVSCFFYALEIVNHDITVRGVRAVSLSREAHMA